jgi:hypothetical protein
MLQVGAGLSLSLPRAGTQGIAFVTSSVSFIATIVKERAITKTTQQLMVMGLDTKILWLSQILGDGGYLLLGFLLPTWILVLVLGIPYLTGVCFGPFVLLTISALFSSLTASYLCVVWNPCFVRADSCIFYRRSSSLMQKLDHVG